MRAAEILRQKVDDGQLTLGILSSFHLWLGQVEMCKAAGLDYLIIDMEHGPFDREKVADCCAVGRMIDFPVLLRPPDMEYTTLRRAIDLGPVGFLLPTVESADQMDRVRDAVYMPPRGSRRPGGHGNRWVSDVMLETWQAEVEDDFIVLPQIESREGLAEVDAIAAHELTYAMAVGPYDLAASLGCCWAPNDEHRAALSRIKQAAHDVGKATWLLGDGQTLVADGYHFICLTETTEFLRIKLAEAAAALRQG